MTLRIGSQPTQQTAAAPATSDAAPAQPKTSMDTAMAKLDGNISSLSSQYGSAGAAGSDAFATSQSLLGDAGGGGISGGVLGRSGGGGSITSGSRLPPASIPTNPTSPSTGTAPTSKFEQAAQGGGGQGGGISGGVGDLAKASSLPGGVDTSALDDSIGQLAGHPEALAPSSPPTMDSAQLALDKAIQSLASSFNKDTYNGQAAPAGVAAAPSNGLTDLFLNQKGGFSAAPALPAPVTNPVLNDPLLDLKGGGGISGGVLGTRSFLSTIGGGGISGGVLGDRSRG